MSRVVLKGQEWRPGASGPIRTLIGPNDSTATAWLENVHVRECLHILHIITIIIIRPRRSRSAAAYSHQTFPCTICRSVCVSVGLSVCLSSALWKTGRSHPAAVWHHRSDGSRDEAGIGVWQSVHGKGYFWGRIWTAPL